MTTDLRTQSLELDSSKELIADQYTQTSPTTDLFRAAARTDRVDFTIGLQTLDEGVVSIDLLTDGVIDEYELPFAVKEHHVTIRGRDQAVRLLDHVFRKYYLRVAPRPPLIVPQPTYGVQFPLPPVAIGTFMASTIAAEAVASVGLTLDWRVRDYTYRKDYQANKRISDILRDLIRPWTQVSAFQAQIWIEGSTVLVDYAYPPTLDPPAELTLTAAEARRLGLTIRKRPMRRIGRVTLEGMPQGTPGTHETRTVSSGYQFGTEVSRVTTVETRWVIRTPVTTQNPTGFTDTGMIKQTVKDTEVALSRQTEPIAGGENVNFRPIMRLAGRETTTYTYEFQANPDTIPGLWDGGKLLNAPLLLSKQTLIGGYELGLTEVNGGSGGGLVWRDDLSRETTSYAYDPVTFFLLSETTVKETRNLTTGAQPAWFPQSMTVRTVRISGRVQISDTSEAYTFNTAMHEWVLDTRNTQLTGGYPAGGPGRGGVAGPPILYQAIVNTETDAQDFSYSDESLNADELIWLGGLFTLANLLWEYELQMEGSTIPYLKRGMYLQITGLVDSFGNTITLPVCVVTEIRLGHDETTPSRPVSRMTIRAFGWSYT